MLTCLACLSDNGSQTQHAVSQSQDAVSKMSCGPHVVAENLNAGWGGAANANDGWDAKFKFVPAEILEHKRDVMAAVEVGVQRVGREMESICAELTVVPPTYVAI